jgi:predicted ester cyclase
MDGEQIARLYYQLFNERRLDEAAQLVDPQCSIHYKPTKQRLMGRAGYRALAAVWINAFEDVTIEITSLQADGDRIVVRLLGRGTHTGDLVLGDAMSIPPTGRRAQLIVKETLDIKNGLIVHEEMDFDLAEMRRVLGMPDAPHSRNTAAEN